MRLVSDRRLDRYGQQPGRVVTTATADEEREVLREVAGWGVHHGAFRYART